MTLGLKGDRNVFNTYWLDFPCGRNQFFIF